MSNDDRTNRTRKRKRKTSAPDWAKRFLSRLGNTGNITVACEYAGVGRRTVYDRRDNDSGFAADMKDALEKAVELLEMEARRRACEGVNKPVIYKGEQMGEWRDGDGKIVPFDAPNAKFHPLYVKEYSDTLMIVLLKAHDPKYRESVKHQHGGDPDNRTPISFLEIPADDDDSSKSDATPDTAADPARAAG